MIGNGNGHPDPLTSPLPNPIGGNSPRLEASEAPCSVRVVLVGRTGFDLPLRMDRAVELVRTATLTGAIGELGNPIDRSVPSRVTVLVGRDAAAAGPGAVDFRNAVRLIEPCARIYRVEPGGAGAETKGGKAEGFDGVVAAELPQMEIRRFVRAVHESSGGDPAPGERPTVQPLPGVAGLSHDADGADSIIEALLHGRDPVPDAIAAIRSRVGDDSVSYVAASETGGDASGLVPVAHQGRTLGWLRTSAASREALDAAARWFGSWLALKEQHDQLRIAALTDDLTGAGNRRYFERFLKAAIESAAANRRSVTLLFFDLDNLKQYNDRFGHAAGDEILRETVRLLKSVIRPTDRVCRIGGDEFAVIFHEPDGPRDPASKPPSSIADIAKRFQRQVCEHRFPKLAEQAPGTITISGGLATYPWDGRTAEELLERADRLSMESKQQGKNVITLGPGAARDCGAEGTVPDEPGTK